LLAITYDVGIIITMRNALAITLHAAAALRYISYYGTIINFIF
jgi:hypothetical protein